MLKSYDIDYHSYALNCESTLRNNKLYCQSEENFKQGYYEVCINETSYCIGYTTICYPLHLVDFHIYLEYESLKLGRNHILIYGDIYDCMDLINKIIVTDSDGESIIHEVNTYYYQEDYNFNYVNNSIYFTLIAYPGKSYSIQLFNEIEGSRIYEFNTKEDYNSI